MWIPASIGIIASGSVRQSSAAVSCGIRISIAVRAASIAPATKNGVSQAVREDALAVLAICALEMVLHNVPAILVMGIFRAGGDTRYGLIIDCITMYLIGLPLTMLTGLYLHWSVPMTYLVMYLSEDIVKCAAYLLHYRSGKWIRPVI